MEVLFSRHTKNPALPDNFTQERMTKMNNARNIAEATREEAEKHLSDFAEIMAAFSPKDSGNEHME